MESAQEIRLRCLEAAARNPTPHAAGYAAGVLDAAQQYAAWVVDETFVLPLIGVDRPGALVWTQPAARTGEGMDELL